MTELLTRLLNILHTPIDMPKPWGTYHWLCIIITVVMVVILVKLFANCSEATTRALAFIFWFIMASLELLKQFSSSASIVGGEITFSYQWHAIPFQFCSTPLYILPLIIILRDSKVRDAAIMFLISFSTVAGITVFLTPETVYSTSAFLNVQTMVHHGIQIFFGIYLAFRYRRKMTLKNFIGCSALFLILSAVAIFLNIWIYKNHGTAVDLFFISPYNRYLPPVLVGLGIENIKYEEFLAGFLGGFITLSGIFSLIMKGFTLIGKRESE